MTSTTYESFVAAKAHTTAFPGIDDDDIGTHLFPHQRDLARWALRKGRAAIFADTGLGKTAMQVEWARHVARRGRVLILCPLAVAPQTVAEAARFGVDVVYRRWDCGDQITITNYDMLGAFDASKFAGIVLDESSILKAFDGKTRNAIIGGFKETPYRLACTATPAPNDFTELGNHSEFLGVKTRAEMLAEFFVHDGGSTSDWRLKGHAVKAFWKWLATWGAVVRKPSDLGYDDAAYDLPPLRFHDVVIRVDVQDAWASGLLFPVNAVGLKDQRDVRRSTLQKRIEAAGRIAGGERWTQMRGAASSGSGTTGTESTSSNTDDGQPRSATPGAESATRRTPPSAMQPDCMPPPTNASTPSERNTSDSAPCMESASTSTAGCLPSRQVDARSAAPTRHATSTREAGSPADSPSTTATEPDGSEGSSAPPATSASASSTTTPPSSAGPRTTSIAPCLIWCELNAEQDALANALGGLAYSVTGSMSGDEKMAAIQAWLDGGRPIMISKASILGFGLNFQHCSRIVFVGASHSYEQTYQAIRRCWRFGQKHPVDVHIIRAETEQLVVDNYRRKEADAARLGAEMAAQVLDSVRGEVHGASAREWNPYAPQQQQVIPSWMTSEVTQ